MNLDPPEISLLFFQARTLPDEYSPYEMVLISLESEIRGHILTCLTGYKFFATT